MDGHRERERARGRGDMREEEKGGSAKMDWAVGPSGPLTMEKDRVASIEKYRLR